METTHTDITTVHSLGGTTYGVFAGTDLAAMVEEIAGGLFCDRCKSNQTCEHCVIVARGISQGTITSLWPEPAPTPPTMYYYKGIPHVFVMSRNGERMYSLAVVNGEAYHVYDPDTSPADRCKASDFNKPCFHKVEALAQYKEASGELLAA
jgi:hypothetical protein